MKLSKKALEAIGYTYFMFFNNKGPLFVKDNLAVEEANSILKVLNIKINKNNISFENLLFINPFLSKNEKIKLKTIPFKGLSQLDIDDIENILNSPKYMFQSELMSPLFDSIGWIMSDTTGKIKINFIGSYTFEIWKENKNEEIIPWNFEIDQKEMDWVSGNDWKDHLDLTSIKKPFWKEIKGKPEDTLEKTF